MSWQQFQQFLKGKVFLIGITFVDKEGELIEHYQTHGTVQELTDAGIFRIRRSDGSIFQLPYDKDTITKMEDGEYREKTSGEIIKNPDYMMTWEIVTSRTDNLDEVKRVGYIPAS
jgi:hypothetical protein